MREIQPRRNELCHLSSEILFQNNIYSLNSWRQEGKTAQAINEWTKKKWELTDSLGIKWWQLKEKLYSILMIQHLLTCTFLLYVVKRQLTICFKSSNPIQIGLCMLMSLSIHLHGLHPDAQYGQTWHLSTQLRSGERTGSIVNHTIVTDPTVRQPGFNLPCHTWSLMNHFWTGQGPCHANLHKWGLAQSPSCDCGQWQTMNHIVDTCPITKFDGGLNLLHEADGDAVIWL